MLTELLVLYTCAGGLNGCSESRAAYISQNEQFKEVVSSMEYKAKQLSGNHVDSIAPLIAVALEKRVTIPVSKSFTIIIKEKEVETKLIYGIEF